MLNERGGPNHVQNFCFAPVHADLSVGGELIYTPTYYYIGHFSKFVKPGAKRVSTAVSRTFLEATTFRNPDNSYATIIMNPQDEAITFSLHFDQSKADLEIPPHAMYTLAYTTGN